MCQRESLRKVRSHLAEYSSSVIGCTYRQDSLTLEAPRFNTEDEKMPDTLDLEDLAAMAAEPDGVEEEDEGTEEGVPDGIKSERGAKITAARVAKMEALFAGKHYTILKEFDLKGRVDKDGNKLRVPTPLGNFLTKGYSIKLDDGFTPAPGFEARMVFGERVLREAEKMGAIEMPPEVVKEGTRTRRSSAEKEELAKKKEADRQALMEALAAELGF